MGADAALGCEPIDWLARGPMAPGADYEWPSKDGLAAAQRGPGPSAATAVSAVSASTPAAVQPTIARALAQPRPPAQARPQTPLSEADSEARIIARQANSIGALGEALAAFNGCTLKATASRLCFYRGAETARVVVIGEAPGRDEDLEGRPFAGAAGRLLDRMLMAIGLAEADVHITNTVYWRPPGGRAATPQELLACRPFLERQIELVAPDVIVTLGGPAAREISAITEPIMKARGKWRDITLGSVTVPAIALLHPDYLLKTPAAKKWAWLDLLAIKARLNG